MNFYAYLDGSRIISGSLNISNAVSAIKRIIDIFHENPKWIRVEICYVIKEFIHVTNALLVGHVKRKKIKV